MTDKRKITFITVAAGSGSRFGGPLPKQFCQIEGRPVVMRAIDSLRAALPEADHIIVVSADQTERWNYLCNLHHFDSPRVVTGGATRTESVGNAVVTLSPGLDDIVMVHDGARPYPPLGMIRALAAAFDDNTIDGALPAVPVTDSIRDVSGLVSEAVDRSRLRAVQTPQAFRATLLAEAYARAGAGTFTDDASVMEAAGFRNFVLVDGSAVNMKITNPADIAIAEALLAFGSV